MSRYNSFITTLQPDFWRDSFRPQDLMRVFSHIHSVLSSRSDMKLLEAYDIKKLPEHTVGYTRTWVPLVLGGETFLGEDIDYPWMYAILEGDYIDSNWLTIDAIYDKHVDPDYAFQNKLDYIYSDGILRFNSKLPSDIKTLYIAKGQYVGYRIRNEIGSLLKYERKDSKFYRDSIEPVMVSFYKGPTVRHLVALLSIAFGMPVTKYDNERVIAIKGGTVTTDKYTYQVPESMVSVKLGDVLPQFTPLATTITLITNKTHPGWWEDKPPTLFQKYLLSKKFVKKSTVPDSDHRTYEEAPENYREILVEGDNITEADRDYLMSTFLKDVVLYIQISVDSIAVDGLVNSQDLVSLFNEALPTRTDPIISTIGNLKHKFLDLYLPDKEKLGVALQLHTVYGTHEEYSPIGMYSPSLGRPTFRADSESDTVYDEESGTWKKPEPKPTDFVVGTHRWHLLDDTSLDNFREFWKYREDMAPIFEPHISVVYGRNLQTPPWEYTELTGDDVPIDLDIPFLTNESIRISYGGTLEDLKPSDIIYIDGITQLKPSIGIHPTPSDLGYFEELHDISINTCTDTLGDIVTVNNLTYNYPDRLETWVYDPEKVQRSLYGMQPMVTGVSTLDNSNDKLFLGKLPKTVRVTTTYTSDYANGANIALTWKTSGSEYCPPKASTTSYLSSYVDNLGDVHDDLLSVTIPNVAGELTLTYTFMVDGDVKPEIKRVLVKIDDQQARQED